MFLYISYHIGEGDHRPSGAQGAGGGATQAVRGSVEGRRGYTGRQGLRGREEGLHRPSGVQGTGGGATQAVRGSGGGRRGYTGRQGFRGREEGDHRLNWTVELYLPPQ